MPCFRNLWNPIYCELLEHLKLITPFEQGFANNTKCLLFLLKLACLKQTNHNMTLDIVETQSTIVELKMVLEFNSLKEIKGKLDKFCMIMILHIMHPNLDHVWDQILTYSKNSINGQSKHNS